jgi:hypothetical protein
MFGKRKRFEEIMIVEIKIEAGTLLSDRTTGFS